jgi:hypothetical protein
VGKKKLHALLQLQKLVIKDKNLKKIHKNKCEFSGPQGSVLVDLGESALLGKWCSVLYQSFRFTSQNPLKYNRQPKLGRQSCKTHSNINWTHNKTAFTIHEKVHN